MASTRANLSLILLAFLPNLALAHGEEVLLFPFGTLAAFAAIMFVSLSNHSRLAIRVFAGVIAIAASVPLWLVPRYFFPPLLRYTGWGNFAVGFLPSLVAGGFVLWLFRRRSSRHNGA